MIISSKPCFVIIKIKINQTLVSQEIKKNQYISFNIEKNAKYFNFFLLNKKFKT